MMSETEQAMHRKAEEEVILKILHEMGHKKGYHKLNKGGRFIPIPSKDQKVQTLETDQQQSSEIDFNSKTGSHIIQAVTNIQPKTYCKIPPSWIDTGPRPKDVTSLILNILIYKFMHHLSLDCKLIMKRDGKSILILIRADEKDLKRVAEYEKYLFQLSVGSTDASSLEPCDEMLVPYRLLRKGNAKINVYEKRLKQLWIILDGESLDLSEMQKFASRI